jgi:hypothetical protein
MTIKEQLKEDKRKAFLIRNVEYDTKQVLSLASQLIEYKGAITPEYKEVFDVFTDLYSEVEQRLNEIKALITVPENLEAPPTL